MKLSITIATLAFVAPAVAFAPSALLSQGQSSTELCATQSSRTAFLKQAAAGLTASAAMAFMPKEAQAAKYGSVGAGSPNVMNPLDAEVDQDLLKSSAVQAALTNVKGYKATVNEYLSALAKDEQANISKRVVKDFDFTKLRGDLNTVGTIYDEDTQRGTDRLIRIILQDITELEIALKIKPDVPRSARRLATSIAKLDKLNKAFDEFLQFAP